MIAQGPPPDRRPGGSNHSRETDDSIVPQCTAKTAVRLCSSQRHKREARQNLSDAARLRRGRKRTGSSNPSRSAILAGRTFSPYVFCATKAQYLRAFFIPGLTGQIGRVADSSPEGRFFSGSLDCGDLVRFSKLVDFQRPANRSGKRFFGFSLG